MKNHDFPLEHIHDDMLGRRTFAYKFAQAIIDTDVSKEGFVAALTGPWGAGKSSTINFIAHYIKQTRVRYLYQELNGENIDIDPELDQIHKKYLPLETLIRTYDFNGKDLRIAPKEFVKDQIRSKLKSENELEQIYQYMLAERLSELHPENIIIKFSPWAEGTQSEISISIMNEISYILDKNFEQNVIDSINEYTREIYKIATIAAASSIGLSSNFNFIIDRLFHKKPKSIIQKKKEISEKLSQSKSRIKKIIIIIDDLDRLTPEESSNLIQTIKGIGNIPRIYYLLSYNKTELPKLINASFQKEEGDEYGKEFLEKIIQYSKEIPLPEETDISKMFETQIDPCLRDYGFKEHRPRLEYAWRNILSKYIKNPRDLKRLMNVYITSLSAIHNVTEPIDLLITSAIEVFEPNSYLKLREEIKQKTIKNEDIPQIDFELILQCSTKKEATKSSLSFLMKEARNHFKEPSIPSPISHRDHAYLFGSRYSLSSYFNLDPNISRIDSKFLEEISANTSPNGILIQSVKDTISRKKDKEDPTLQYFEILSENLFREGTEISKEWMIEIIESINFILKSNKNTLTQLSHNSISLAEKAITSGLLSIKEQSKRSETFIRSIENQIDISFTCQLCRNLIGDDRKDGEGLIITYNPFDYYEKKIRETLLEKIHNYQKNRNLLNQNDFKMIAWFWWGSGDDTELYRFIDEHLEEDSRCIELLQKMLSKKETSSGPVFYFSHMELDKIGGINRYHYAIKRLEDSASPESQEAGKLLRSALNEDGYVQIN
jgi:hypothetical protein